MKKLSLFSFAIRFFIFICISLTTAKSLACGGHLSMSIPHMHENEMLINVLESSQGEKPKPFSFKDLQLTTEPKNNQDRLNDNKR